MTDKKIRMTKRLVEGRIPEEFSQSARATTRNIIKAQAAVSKAESKSAPEQSKK